MGFCNFSIRLLSREKGFVHEQAPNGHVLFVSSFLPNLPGGGGGLKGSQTIDKATA